MASLNGTQINNTYPSLLKVTDNGPVGAGLKNITDGAGNTTPLSMGSNYIQLQADTIELIEPTGGTNLMMITPTNISFEGAVDFTFASVTGIGGGSAGLINGTGVNSLTVDGTLLSLAPEATGLRSIGLGQNARSRADDCIVIGNGLVDDAARVNTVVIGSHGARETKAAQYSTVVGSGAQALGSNCIAIGNGITSSGNSAIMISSQYLLSNGNAESVFIGNGPGTTFGFSSKNVQIGWETKGAGLNSNTIGRGAKGTGSWSSALAYNAEATGEQSTAVSYGSKATAQGTFAAADRAQATASRAIAIGGQSTSALADAAVIGPGLTALWAAGTTVNQLAMSNYASINYADDTAAAAGGVPLGGVYHNAGALRVRIA